MNRPLAVLAAAACFAILALPASSAAHSRSHRSDDDEHGLLGWAVVSGGNTSMSDLSGIDSIEELRDRFGDEFLYLRDGRDRWVIEDRKLVRRAREATREIGRYGREIGEIASVQVRLALSRTRGVGRQVALRLRQEELERRIEQRERRGESTRDLERRLERVTDALESIDSDDGFDRLSPGERRDLERRREEATRRLRRATRHLQDEMRDILREARAQDLAEPLD